MAVIDHLVYAVADLDEGVVEIERRLGARAAYGGSHPGRGTHNALRGLGDSYREIIGPDPDQPEPAEGRPFEVTTTMTPRLVTFAVRPDVAADETIDSLAAALAEVGHDPGPVLPMSRATPDGTELHWRLTFPTLALGGAVPFLIDWGDTPNPATTAPPAGHIIHLSGIPTAIMAALHLPSVHFSVRSGPVSDADRTESGSALRADIEITVGAGGSSTHVIAL